MNMAPEIVAHDPKNDFSSGGGFSNYFARPSYQDSVVPDYINNLDGEFGGLFNTSGRGYPDIAAQGFHIITIWNGTVVQLDGTRFVGHCALDMNTELNHNSTVQQHPRQHQS